MILVVDIGNTTISFAVFDLQKKTILKTFFLEKQLDISDIRKEIKLQSGDFYNTISGIVIASVVPNLTKIYSKPDILIPNIAPLIITHNNYPIKNNYKQIKKLGIDRLCNIAAAKEIFKTSVIVIDIGSAINIEVIDSHGNFAGGLILPGPKLAKTILNSQTALLPDIKLQFPQKIIGSSTEECIQSGIMNGYAALCREIIISIENELNLKNKMKVILSGGFSSVFADKIPRIDIIEQNLVIKGAAFIYKHIQK